MCTGHCEDCRWWIGSEEAEEPVEADYHGADSGKCIEPHWVDASRLYGDHVKEGCVYVYDAENYATSWRTHRRFGCIHFEPRGGKQWVK